MPCRNCRPAEGRGGQRFKPELFNAWSSGSVGITPPEGGRHRSRVQLVSPDLLLPFAALFVSVAAASGALANYVLRRTSAVDRRLRDLKPLDARPATAAGLDLTRSEHSVF